MNEYRLDFSKVVKQLAAKKKVKAKNLVMTCDMCLDEQLSIHMLMKTLLMFDEICLVIDMWIVEAIAFFPYSLLLYLINTKRSENKKKIMYIEFIHKNDTRSKQKETNPMKTNV